MTFEITLVSGDMIATVTGRGASRQRAITDAKRQAERAHPDRVWVLLDARKVS